jgi:uncharacterized membrane protein YGL010W
MRAAYRLERAGHALGRVAGRGLRGDRRHDIVLPVLSLTLAIGMLAVVAGMALTLVLLGDRVLLVSLPTFAAAWIGQFIGHAIEGRKPAFVDDLRSFLVAPAWLLGDLYRRLGLRY